jgi:peptide/nickel transport system substrate-binding protein
MHLNLERYSIIDRLFSLIERTKSSDRLLMRTLFFTTVILGVLFLYGLNQKYTSPTPTSGGVLVEGIVGIPRFVNPSLAITRADQDAVALVYSGLLKINTEGELVPDIAESITVSEDGRTYRVIVRQDRKFYDTNPITAKDVIFTIKLVQNPDLKSPLRGNWSNVTIEEVSEYEFDVVLSEAYAPFIENFTLGIMPEHIWGKLPIEQLPFSQYNTEPIGSGSFGIKDVTRDVSGLISSYILEPAPNNQETPNLSAIELRFFQNEDLLMEAFNKKEITSTVYLPLEYINEVEAEDIQILNKPLPRNFALFFNQNQAPSLRDKAARAALNKVINRDEVIAASLNGFGVPTTKPIIENSLGLESSSTEEVNTSLEEARQILIKGGWEQNESGFWEKEIDKATETLSLTIKTGNLPLNEKTVEVVAKHWRELGVEVQVDQYEQSGLVQSVIKTRDYQVLFFGLDMNRTQDLYPFWHSSQKDDPGLNISQYTNITVDRLLEKAKSTQNQEERMTLLDEASVIISDEVPAIFLFAPSVAYVVNKDIVPTEMNKLGKPADRFMNVSDWYAKTEVVWPIFQKDGDR